MYKYTVSFTSTLTWIIVHHEIRVVCTRVVSTNNPPGGDFAQKRQHLAASAGPGGRRESIKGINVRFLCVPSRPLWRRSIRGKFHLQ